MKRKMFLYGADYNPDQWLNMPEILNKDIKLMKLAHCNTMTIGIFSWATLEPEEGKYDFEWLDKIIDNLYANGISVILATPSAAKPAWMAEKYPEILRTQANRVRDLYGQRQNHCYTSPVYRKKVHEINTLLAQRYKNHPGIVMWHISNEYGRECHCELCQKAFRTWLKNKYNNSLDKLNDAWYTKFWGHTITSWSQIQSPAPNGEHLVHALNLDWKRFVTHQTIDFFENEIEPLRRITPNIPITTNFMGNGFSDKSDFGIYEGLNYSKFAKKVDVVSYDSYPMWHNDEISTWNMAVQVSYIYDLVRSLKTKPFIMMESTPSLVNWHRVNKIKRPKMNELASLQAIAHGSDSVMYFQWRKSRGGSEKFHGAIVDHSGSQNTRVFKESCDLGKDIEKIKEISGSNVKSEVALIFDWENMWALNDFKGLRNDKREYQNTCIKHYKTFLKKSIPVDIIDEEHDFNGYKVIIAPMLYMLKDGVSEKIKEYVRHGGVVIATYLTGIVNENDLCFLSGFPGTLREMFGIWAEEVDSLYDKDFNEINVDGKDELHIAGRYTAKTICEIIHAEGAKVLGTYVRDYYAGMPALTVNDYGKGKAYYIASNNDEKFIYDFYSGIINKMKLSGVLSTYIPDGVCVRSRKSIDNEFIFIMNFTEEIRKVNIKENNRINLISGEKLSNEVVLEPYETVIYKK